MRVRVDPDICLGSGICVVDAPTVFELDEDDKAVVVDPTGATVSEDVLWEAARDCPTEAIVLEDDLGNQLYP